MLNSTGADWLEFIGSATRSDDVTGIAADMRNRLNFGMHRRREFSTWAGSLRNLIEASEQLGVLVMVSGIVGNNTRRKLNPREFRGFVLEDHYAPLLFINGADTKAAQIFTLAHELAHLWLGESGVSRPELDAEEILANERWCNQAAAELLVPMNLVPSRSDLTGPTLTEDLQRLAREFKVSTLVVLRRLYDARHFQWEEFRNAYAQEFSRVSAISEGQSPSGGNFYYTQPYRVSRRFARALITSTLEGETQYSDAFRLLGVRKYSTFEELGEYVGVA